MKDSDDNDFILCNETEPIAPLFNSIWGAMFAVFSYLIEVNSDPEIVGLCIEGFIQSIKICGFYNMLTERDAFVGCLAKLTGLSQKKDMQDKNILCT